MNALLIAPPFYRLMACYNRYFPYGLLTLATAAARAGHSAAVYDADSNDSPEQLGYTYITENYPRYLAALKDDCHPAWEEMRGVLRERRPDVVGIQLYTDTFASAMASARVVKEASPRPLLVMGGPHARVKADEVFGLCPEVDCLVSGEGEVPFVEILNRSEAGRSDLSGIPGVSFRRGGAAVHPVAPAEVLPGSALTFPDRRMLLFPGRYTPEDMGLVISSRGCPYACSYCATETRVVRHRDLDDVVREIESVREAYGTIQFAFKDDSFPVDRRRVEALCDLLTQKNLGINWECNSRVNLTREDLLRKMKRAGCNFVKVGVESGSARVLEYMNKGVGLQQTEDAARAFRKAGVHWTGYFMMGVPGETREDILATLAALRKLRPDFAALGVYQAYPGTAMFEDGARRGLVRRDMRREDFFETLPHNYYKMDPRVQTDCIPPGEYAELEALMKKSFHRYNKSLFRAARLAASRARTYRKSPGTLWSDFRKFLKFR